MISSETVIVAGAGPVGLLAALKLAREGIHVIVVDELSFIGQWPRAVVYHPPTVSALDNLGLLSEMIEKGLIKRDYQWRTIEGEMLLKLDMSSIEDKTQYPYNLHLGQHVMAEIILNHLLKMQNVDVLWNSKVVAVTQTDSQVEVTLKTDEKERTIRSNWLIGADGASSGVRKCLGLEFKGITWPERFVVTNVYSDIEAFGYAKATFIVDPDEFSVICQINKDKLWRVAFAESSDLPIEELNNRLHQRLERLIPGPYDLDEVSPFRVHQRVIDNLRVGRVLFAGDAAHANSPIGGLGLTGGLLDAVALADALSAVIHQRSPESVLDQYARERRDIFVNYTSPVTTENKRRMSERDSNKRAADKEYFKAIGSSPELQANMLLATNRLVGSSFKTS